LEQFGLGNVRRYGILRKKGLGFLKPLIRRSLYARALALRARFLVVPAEGYVSVLTHLSEDERSPKIDKEVG
jgi:hypothetical protein